MKKYLEDIVPDSGFHHLSTHIKTNKSSLMMQWLLEAGISSYKTSMNEAELAARSGAKDIFVAYPLLMADAQFIAQLVSEYPDTAFSVQVGGLEHAKILQKGARRSKIRWSYFIDVDVGMHRTGSSPQKVFEIYKDISRWPELEFIGLHGYDGHNHHASLRERREEVQISMETLLKVMATFRKNKITVPRLITAGSLTFCLDLAYLYPKIGKETHLQVSPGTWIYWDSEYDRLMPGGFEFAALIVTQVIDISENNRIILNLGHKRWGADRGPVDLFSHSDLRVVSFNEEHTVLQNGSKDSFKIGDYILIVPKHVCSTVNLYEYFTVIGESGAIENLEVPVDGRNR